MTFEFYETIKSEFQKLDFSIYHLDLSFYYSINDVTDASMEECKDIMTKIKDSFFDSLYYKNCIKLSCEDYITMITINMFY